MCSLTSFFFFNDTATTEIYTLSLHDALPIYPPAHGAVFLPDRRRLGLEPLPDARAPPGVRRPRRDPRQAVERPPQFHAGGPRGPEQPHQLVHPAEEAVARRRPQVPRPRDEAQRRRDPDERRAAQLERADRVRHSFPTLQVALDLRLGQCALVDDPHGAGGRPSDSLHAHGPEPNAECGVRNAECQWRVEARVTPALKFRTPHSAFRTLRVGFWPWDTKLSCSRSKMASLSSPSTAPIS